MSMVSKAVAGSVLGFILSACLIALALWPLHRHGQTILIPSLIGFFPLWIAVITASFKFRSALQAWLVLGVLDLACWAVLQCLHHAQAY